MGRYISYVAKEFPRYVHAPTKDDVEGGGHLLRYFAGKNDECVYLRPRKKKKITLAANTDAGLAGCRTSGKFTLGGCIS